MKFLINLDSTLFCHTCSTFFLFNYFSTITYNILFGTFCNQLFLWGRKKVCMHRKIHFFYTIATRLWTWHNLSIKYLIPSFEIIYSHFNLIPLLRNMLLIYLPLNTNTHFTIGIGKMWPDFNFFLGFVCIIIWVNNHFFFFFKYSYDIANKLLFPKKKLFWSFYDIILRWWIKFIFWYGWKNGRFNRFIAQYPKMWDTSCFFFFVQIRGERKKITQIKLKSNRTISTKE